MNNQFTVKIYGLNMIGKENTLIKNNTWEEKR